MCNKGPPRPKWVRETCPWRSTTRPASELADDPFAFKGIQAKVTQMRPGRPPWTWGGASPGTYDFPAQSLVDPPFGILFHYFRTFSRISHVPARASQDQLANISPVHNHDPNIMIIIDSTHHHLSIIIIIIGGRGCGLVRYCDHELASWPAGRKLFENVSK